LRYLLLLLAACAATPPEATEAVHLPVPETFTAPGGMRVYLLPNSEVPLVGFEVRIAAGALHDPPGKEGTANLLARLLTKGAGDRDAKSFQEAVDFVGGSFSASAGARWLTIEAEFMKEHTDLALDLLADVLRRPRLDADQFEKQKGQRIDALRAARQEPSALIHTYYNGWLFQGQAYARPVSGDERSLAALTNEDVRSFAQEQIQPGKLWLAVVGDFDAAKMTRMLAERFDGWEGERTDPTPPVVEPAKGDRVLLVDKPDALQTYFQFGNLGFDWSDPDYPARYLANTVLGGRFTSRLNTALRIRGGLTYGAHSWFDDGRAGAFRVSTHTPVKTSREAIDLAVQVYREFVDRGLTQAELDSARDYVKGQYAPDNLETAGDAASMILALDANGLPRAIIDELFANLDALTLDEVNRVIRERFPAEELSWVVIGPADRLEPIVNRFGTITRISIDGPGFAP
jgi:predicted Zn-dependent peptidase